jgi:hypothetical protein
MDNANSTPIEIVWFKCRSCGSITKLGRKRSELILASDTAVVTCECGYDTHLGSVDADYDQVVSIITTRNGRDVTTTAIQGSSFNHAAQNA